MKGYTLLRHKLFLQEPKKPFFLAMKTKAFPQNAVCWKQATRQFGQWNLSGGIITIRA